MDNAVVSKTTVYGRTRTAVRIAARTGGCSNVAETSPQPCGVANLRNLSCFSASYNRHNTVILRHATNRRLHPRRHRREVH